MILINTDWENKNLNVDSCEIVVGEEDLQLSESDIVDFINNNTLDKYKYIVFKTSIINLSILNAMAKLKFMYIENQLSYELKKDDYFKSDSFEKYNSESYSCSRVNNKPDFDFVVSEIIKGIYTTDRISLDNKFGIEVSNRRYANWAKNIFESNKGELFIVYNNDVPIGFEIGEFKEKHFNMILSGLFTNFQHKGVGNYWQNTFLNTIFKQCDSVKTNVSSNNMSIIKIRQKANFTITSIKTVYIKNTIV